MHVTKPFLKCSLLNYTPYKRCYNINHQIDIEKVRYTSIYVIHQTFEVLLTIMHGYFIIRQNLMSQLYSKAYYF